MKIKTFVFVIFKLSHFFGKVFGLLLDKMSTLCRYGSNRTGLTGIGLQNEQFENNSHYATPMQFDKLQ